jgi:EAL domain-containing protein (putative c-di-GMP-specific phosphodiesterase class I)
MRTRSAPRAARRLAVRCTAAGGWCRKSASSWTVTSAAISFGNSLDIEVIAEGLESAQVLDFLEDHDCHRAQGFYLARPMPGEQFAQWVRQAGMA